MNPQESEEKKLLILAKMYDSMNDEQKQA